MLHVQLQDTTQPELLPRRCSCVKRPQARYWHAGAFHSLRESQHHCLVFFHAREDSSFPPMATTPEFGNVTLVRHPLVQHKLTILRDRSTPTKIFKELVDEIARPARIEGHRIDTAASMGLAPSPAALRLLTTRGGARGARPVHEAEPAAAGRVPVRRRGLLGADLPPGHMSGLPAVIEVSATVKVFDVSFGRSPRFHVMVLPLTLPPPARKACG